MRKKWPHLFPLNRPHCVILRHNNRPSLPAYICFADSSFNTLLDLVPELNLDLSNSCSIHSFRIKYEVIFLTNSFPCSSVPIVRLYPPFLCYSLSTKPQFLTNELFNFHHIFETKIRLKNCTERDSTQKRDIKL